MANNQYFEPKLQSVSESDKNTGFVGGTAILLLLRPGWSNKSQNPGFE
jgi:hypothetical protein